MATKLEPNRGKQWPLAMRRQAVAAVKNGQGRQLVADTYGIPYGTLCQWCQEENVSRGAVLYVVTAADRAALARAKLPASAMLALSLHREG